MKTLFFLLTTCIISLSTFAQETVNGIVSDAKGIPIEGAKVYVKGGIKGIFTDDQGAFSLEIPAKSKTLVVSAFGFTKREVIISEESLSILLLRSAKELDQVAITALGIEQGKRSLGYEVSSISLDQIETRSEVDISRILRGKAAGVDIQQASGLTGSSTSIIIRGYSSITGDNQPLFVVDGVPFNSATNTDNDFIGGGATASSRILDLDPQNIAEVSILKGLSATVLYGEAGRNGVILISTKNARAGENIAKANKTLEINISQKFGYTEIAGLPEYQNSYGVGFFGRFGWFLSSWGPKFDPSSRNWLSTRHPYDQARYSNDFPEFRSVSYPYEAHQSVENFFRKGVHQSTSFSIESNLSPSTSARISYTVLDDEGFLPEEDNTFQKHNLGLGFRTQLKNGLKFASNFNFVKLDRNAPITGASVGPGELPSGTPNLFGYLFFTPRSIDLMNLPFESPSDGSMVYYRRGSPIENPRWTAKHTNDSEVINRLFGNVNVGYDFTKYLSFNYRIGLDQYGQTNIRTVNKGGSVNPGGQLMTSDRQIRRIDQVATLQYALDLTEDVELSGMIGANLQRNELEMARVNSTEQFIFDNFAHVNFQTHTSDSYDVDQNTLGTFATSQLGYKDFLYLNFQGRKDWVSSTDEANRSRFYPAVSLSFIPTEAIADLRESRAVNFVKMRFGYGTSASYYSAYQQVNLSSPINNASEVSGSNTSGKFPLDMITGTQDLRPETSAEIEAGIEAGFLANRIGIDITVYNKTSKDLIIAQDISANGRYERNFQNAVSVENKGVEAGVHLVPFENKLVWTLGANMSINRNKVISISDGLDQVLIAGFNDLGNFAIPGEFFGLIQGFPFQRNEFGELLVSDEGPSFANYLADTVIAPIGNPNPNYIANFFSSISFKGFRVSGQLTYIDGGDIYSAHAGSLLGRGTTVDTDEDREIPLILPGVLASDRRTPNNLQDFIGNTFYRKYLTGADVAKVFDGTSLRLREISLSYELPEKWLEKSFFSSISLIASGENLWYKAYNFPEGLNYDTDVSSFGAGNGRGFEFSTGPTSKRNSMTLQVAF